MTLPKSMAADALVTAIDGGRVIVLASTLSVAGAVMRDILREYPELHTVAEIRRINGAESLTFPGGGFVRFGSVRQSYRGASFDRCYVPIGTSADVLIDLRPTLCTSTDGLMVGY